MLLVNIVDVVNWFEVVLVSLYVYEGMYENWYFFCFVFFFEEFVCKVIDVGVIVVIGYGLYMLCGVEIYCGWLIFYLLGSLLMEFEVGM